MIARETLRIAWSGLLANKLRSGLTILGMTIGVASVIVLIAVGNGSSKAVQARIQSLGTNVLLVTPQGGRAGPGGSSATSISLTKQDA
ncbi:MAG TPA: ABC transporter permease, partial [Solirubrobacteraceae bacterium]